MRPLEWLLVLSFVPGLLLPFAPRPRTGRFRLGLTLLPAAALLPHLLVEGWRVQMVPVYLLAAVVPATRLPTMRRRTSGSSDGRPGRRAAFRGAAAVLGLALALVLSGVLAGRALPVPTLPRPTGPYRVGVVDRELVDASRGRRLMATVWYPAASRASGGASSNAPLAPLTRHPGAIAAGLTRLTGVPALAFQHLRYVTTAAREGAPVLAGGPRLPVLVFSHGMVGLRLQNAPTCQELASWGYVVVALDHTDAAAVTVFPDGTARYYDLARLGVPAGVEPDEAVMTARVLPVWVADQRFAYGALGAWDARDPVLAGRLDLARVGSFGHSFGGATALEVCRVDARCRAAADLDGGLYGALLTEPAVRPLLLLTSEASGRLPSAVVRWARLVGRAGAPAAWLELPGSSHLSFTFTQLLSPLLAPRGFDPRAGLRTTGAYLRAFFDAQLRGRPTWPPARPLGPTRATIRDGADVRWRTR